VSQLTEFYRRNGTDSEGRTIDKIWAYDHDLLEATHDYIQWLFPLRVPSGFNPNAPVLTDADAAEFRADPKLRENVRRSFTLYLDFLGLRYEGTRVVLTDEFNRNGIFDGPDHNWLRITRILTSTRLLGLETESRAFFALLKQLRDEGQTGITADSFAYWEEAATGDLAG
jgi:hypothetical protein